VIGPREKFFAEAFCYEGHSAKRLQATGLAPAPRPPLLPESGRTFDLKILQSSRRGEITREERLET